MGVRYKGYCSDMTRTVYIGAASAEDEARYNHILKAQETAIAEAQAGTLVSTIAQNCRTHLGEDFERYFTHSLGHGLGTQVHEWPRVSKKEHIKLTEGMYITIEPGVYMPNTWGIRIEDDVLITADGPIVLTTTSKEFLSLP